MIMDTKSDEFKLLRKRALKSIQSDSQIIEDLKQRRKELGLSQEEVAYRMGVSQPDISMIEKGNADPRQSTLRRYANAVSCMIDHELIPFKDESDLPVSETVVVGYEGVPCAVENRHISGSLEGVTYLSRLECKSYSESRCDGLPVWQGA